MIGRHFFAGDKAYDATEIPSADEIKAPEQLAVELPTPNADFHTLAVELAKSLPREAALPKTVPSAKDWLVNRRKKLAEIVKWKRYEAQAEPIGESNQAGNRVTTWKLKLDSGWTVPVVELNRAANPKGQFSSSPTPVGPASHRRQRRCSPMTGASCLSIRSISAKQRSTSAAYLWGLLISAVGERPLGVQAAQIAAVARWLTDARKAGPVRLDAYGPSSCLMVLVAAALEEKAIGDVRINQPLLSLKDIIAQNRSVEQSPELFCFGLLEWFDMKQLVALVAPRQLEAPDAAKRVSKSDLEDLEVFFDLLQNDEAAMK